MTNKPNLKPQVNKFSSGPCAKRPNWNANFLNDTNLLGRSHRSKEVLKVINEVNSISSELLNLPEGYKIAIIAASDTGAFEAAMWNMLGVKGVDVIYFEAFGSEWYKAITEQLRIKDVRKYSANFGQFPDISKVDFDRDVVFTLNGTTSGVCINDLSFIPKNRKGLTFCDATSAAFSMPIDFAKLDVTTYSWQKSLGGEAQHGVLILSPNAVSRIKDYTPNWPLPKIYQLKKKGEFNASVFEGSVINTTSTICILDALDTLNWIKDNGGIEGMYKRVNENFETISDFLKNSPNFENLCADEKYQSRTSVCFKPSQNWFKEMSEDNQRKFIDKVASILQEEKVAFDIKGYNSAPPSFRVWCGLTVDSSDIKILCDWFEYAYETARKS
ncbi:MAG: phosphoserine transaminase [Pelagibacterales bacterium]|nr:phosphoserine transaminase [Pelagibacterales bacterium]